MKIMAKSEQIKKTEKKTGIFQWFFVIIIPLIFAGIITFIVFSLMGIDVIDKSKEFINQIPVVGQYVTTEEEAELERKEQRFVEQLNTKDEEINSLESQLVDYQLEIDQLNQEIVKLTKQLEILDEETQEDDPVDENLEKLTKTYQEMRPQSAAVIMASLDENVAIMILQELNDEQRGSILSEMNPETAAQLTEMILD